MPRATTVRFTDEMYARLDQASARTGMPVNSIVVAACLEWMQRHTPETAAPAHVGFPVIPAAPRWATLRRALGQVALGGRRIYPFASFTERAQELLIAANTEAQTMGHSYIGTEHLLLASFGEGFHSARVLAALHVQHVEVDRRLKAMLGREKVPIRQRIVPTLRVKKIMEIAFGLTGDGERVGTHHILLATSKEGAGIAAQVLNDLGAPLEKIEQEVAGLKDPES